MHLYSSYQESNNHILLQGIVTSWWMSRGGCATSILHGAELGGAARVQRLGVPGSCVGSTVGPSAALRRDQGAGDVPRVFDKKQKCHRREKKRNKTKPSKGNRSPVGSHENLCLALRNSRKIAGKTKVVFCDGG